MTNINCSENCIYQIDGKCSFEDVSSKILTPDSNCAYFVKSKNKN